MKASEVRAMSVAELNTKLDALKKDLFMPVSYTHLDVYKRQS